MLADRGAEFNTEHMYITAVCLFFIKVLQYYSNVIVRQVVFVALLGLFFIIPCTDTYTKVDLRTVSFDVPPQEVNCL